MTDYRKTVLEFTFRGTPKPSPVPEAVPAGVAADAGGGEAAAG